MEITEQQLENLNSIISDYADPIEQAMAITNEFKFSEIELVMSHLTNAYKNLPNMLHEFWNQQSDSCPLEASEMERQELEWRKFIRLKYYQLNKKEIELPDYMKAPDMAGLSIRVNQPEESKAPKKHTSYFDLEKDFGNGC